MFKKYDLVRTTGRNFVWSTAKGLGFGLGIALIIKLTEKNSSEK